MNKMAESSFDTLNRFAANLTEKATKGLLDPVIGRDEEIRRVIQVLSRRTKNNPILIGEPGVGKTAIAEGLAIRIANKDVPEKLKTKQIFSLDLASILAGAKFRGDFEERLKSLLNEIEKEQENIILFIDEIHSLVGAGGGDGSLDASNIFKPALARGDLHCIGATTLDEYRKYIEKDKALERRFQQVYINEPDLENSISMMRGIKEKYELFHGIAISDKALLASVNLSSRYINDRYLPDKAIDLIDEAASRKRIEIDSKPDELDEIDRRIIQLQIEKKVLIREIDKSSEDRLLKVEEELEKLQLLSKNETIKWNSGKKLIEEEQHKKIELENSRNELDKAKRDGNWDRAGELSYQIIPNLEDDIKKYSNSDDSLNTTVNEEDVALVVSKWTGIPVEKMLEAERSKLLKIEAELKKIIVGQDNVISAISKTIIRSRAGLNDSSSPIGSFLFLGSTGVGKTETAKTLAQFLFNDRNAIIRIDMSEYMEKHSVSRLIGAPPGYIGHEEGGTLTEAVRRRPYRVILFDEIEKAHIDVLNILLQVMDDGRLTDSHGKIVDFTNTIIILTSNIGAEHFNTEIDFSKDDSKNRLTKNNIMNSVKSKLSPEFINRLDEILFFSKLGKSHISKIVEIQLLDLRRRLLQKNIKIDWNAEVRSNIVLTGYSPEYGARPIKRKIRSAIENKISELIINNEAKDGNSLFIEVEDNNIKVVVKK
jgi:ATP-dependent Clp protease ATP-binding subunit ClpB